MMNRLRWVDVRSLPMRSQVLVTATFLALISLGTGLAYLRQSRALNELAQSMDRNLAVLVELPNLRERLRQTDQLTDQFLLTGNPLWLEQRQGAVRLIHESGESLSALLSEHGERAVAGRMQTEVADYLAQQERWVARKAAGQLTQQESARIAARRRHFNEIADLVLSMSDVSVSDLRARRAAVRRASEAALGLILGAGLAAALAGVFLLTRYVVRPVAELDRQAGAWQLGQPWTYSPAAASPEIRSLISHFGQTTERLNKQYNHELELSRFKTQLVAIVSHEFNNALNILVGVSSLLEDSEGAASTPRRKELFGMLKSNIRTLIIAATNLLNMGRLESGRFSVSPRATDPGQLLHESAERLQILAQQKRQSVTVESPEGLPPVSADPEAMSLVVANLLSNAIKYTPEGGSIQLGAAAEDGGVRLYCRDNGIGIPAEEQQRIAADFYRTEEGQKAARGYGVGLSLARRILEAHGSALGIQSEPGKGSTFSFLLKAWEKA